MTIYLRGSLICTKPETSCAGLYGNKGYITARQKFQNHARHIFLFLQSHQLQTSPRKGITCFALYSCHAFVACVCRYKHLDTLMVSLMKQQQRQQTFKTKPANDEMACKTKLMSDSIMPVHVSNVGSHMCMLQIVFLGLFFKSLNVIFQSRSWSIKHKVFKNLTAIITY